MDYPSAFCSICTNMCKHELSGLMLSLSIHHPNSIFFCMCDSITKKFIEDLYLTKDGVFNIKLDVKWDVSLDKYSNKTRSDMENNNTWTDFQNKKADIIYLSLQSVCDVMYLDTDIIVLDKLNVDKTKKLGLSPHYIKKSDTDQYGYYNGGCLWTSCTKLPNLWKNYNKTSRYFDQASIEDLANDYKNDLFLFGENYNFSWWRLIQSDEDMQKIVSYIELTGTDILYKKKPIKFVHTHFDQQRFGFFNNLIINILKKCNRYKELLCIDVIINKKWVIKIPKQPLPGIWHHNNDSFRELLYLVEDQFGDQISVIEDPNTGHCWMGSILLYDRPTTEWCNNEMLKASTIFVGNCNETDLNNMSNHIKKPIKPFIFWPRHPKALENHKNTNIIKTFEDRKYNTVFIGNYENSVQQQFRCKNNWEDYIDFYSCTHGFTKKFTQNEYLNKLADSKYGLCLRGYGAKCHREVELMGLGTVPIITPEVDIESYYDKPIENVHYIRIQNCQDIHKIINSISKEKWHQMSKNCVDWYNRNTHSKYFLNNFLNHALYYTDRKEK